VAACFGRGRTTRDAPDLEGRTDLMACGVPIPHPYLWALIYEARRASLGTRFAQGGPGLVSCLLLVCSVLRNALRSRQHLLLENLALRQQLTVSSRKPRRPRLEPRDRLFWSWLSRLWSGWRSAVVLVQPETVIRWRRPAWRRYWAWRSRRSRGPGRPRVPREAQVLIRRMARENRRWGSIRIVGELHKLG
jgi:hypothetical protein